MNRTFIKLLIKYNKLTLNSCLLALKMILRVNELLRVMEVGKCLMNDIRCEFSVTLVLTKSSRAKSSNFICITVENDRVKPVLFHYRRTRKVFNSCLNKRLKMM